MRGARPVNGRAVGLYYSRKTRLFKNEPAFRKLLVINHGIEHFTYPAGATALPNVLNTGIGVR